MHKEDLTENMILNEVLEDLRKQAMLPLMLQEEWWTITEVCEANSFS